jgi:hypothetical protein
MEGHTVHRRADIRHIFSLMNIKHTKFDCDNNISGNDCFL